MSANVFFVLSQLNQIPITLNARCQAFYVTMHYQKDEHYKQNECWPNMFELLTETFHTQTRKIRKEENH